MLLQSDLGCVSAGDGSAVKATRRKGQVTVDAGQRDRAIVERRRRGLEIVAGMKSPFRRSGVYKPTITQIVQM